MKQELFTEIKKDHQEVKGLFSKLEQEESPQERTKLLELLKRELVPHLKAEEKVVYPALMGEGEAKEDALESIEEHHAAKLILRELLRTAPDHERFKAKVTVLMEMIDHHIREEEKNIFKDLKDNLDDNRIKELYDGFMEAKRQIKA